MRVQSLFRSPSTAPKANAVGAPESERDLGQATEPVVRGATAEAWERARRWSTSD